jgi:uncharacterized membrane protein
VADRGERDRDADRPSRGDLGTGPTRGPSSPDPTVTLKSRNALFGDGHTMAEPLSWHSGPPAQEERSFHPRHWLYGGLGIMFALIGVGVLIAALYPGRFGSGGKFWPFGFWFPWWLFFFFFAFLWWVPRWGWVRGYYGGRYRHYGFDPAHSIARERYARGEISKEQYDQIVRDLG